MQASCFGQLGLSGWDGALEVVPTALGGSSLARMAGPGKVGLVPRALPCNRPPLCRPVRQSVSCHSSVATRLELSTYNFPARRPLVYTWLEECIHAAVKNLHEAPFLQLMSPDRPEQFVRHRIAPAVVHVPQLWRGIAEHVGRADPEVLVLVHPIPMEEQPVAEESMRRAARDGAADPGRVLSGIAAQSSYSREHHLRLQACAQLVQNGIAETQLAGKIGDCCDDDEVVSQVVPFSRPNAAHSAQNFSLPQADCCSSVRFWGVVIQTKTHPSEVEGCYVLKTVQSGNPSGCHCTHYTLTRVCRGEPLAAQLASSWLVQGALSI